MNISNISKEKTVKYMTETIEKVIKTFGKRNASSIGERNTQMYFEEELRKYTDNTSVEKFIVYPDAFMGWMYITATCLILGSILYFFLPVFSIILFLMGFTAMISQLALYKQWLDPLFKKKSSLNVFARKRPIGEIKQRVVLCGHADAAFEWSINYKYGFIGFFIELVVSVTGGFYLFGISLAYIIANGFKINTLNSVYMYLGIGLIPFVISWIALYFFSNEKVVVDGANDNLTACLMSIGIAKLLKEEDINLENTEFCVLITGSEEAGLRGARAFCDQHRGEFEDVETIFIVYETLREEEHLCVYTSEINKIYKTDKQVAALIRAAGIENNINIPFKSAVFAGTDSAAFGEAGLKSTCVAALDHKLKEYYHTRKDTYTNLNPKLLAKILDVTLTAIENFDKNGLPLK